mmetsp:Transcript_36666/g.146576  ORF Transcript_36666/g.146576 Transcript_36666/m.146576 type:complete len:163 (-) Transcript_36666:479-967(-)
MLRNNASPKASESRLPRSPWPAHPKSNHDIESRQNAYPDYRLLKRPPLFFVLPPDVLDFEEPFADPAADPVAEPVVEPVSEALLPAREVFESGIDPAGGSAIVFWDSIRGSGRTTLTLFRLVSSIPIVGCRLLCFHSPSTMNLNSCAPGGTGVTTDHIPPPS